MIREGSCNGKQACKGVSGNTLIYSGSCSDVYSCAKASGDTTIQEDACNMVAVPAKMSLATLLFTVGVALMTGHAHMHLMLLQSMRMHAMVTLPVIVCLATL
jgi:hypothetical protein